IDATILTPAAPSVQSSGVKSIPRRKWGRIYHAVITVSEISPQLRALGRHLTHCSRKGRQVRIPAMRGSDLGAFLRALEVSRAVN
ncbi:MAG TPA: hypothetical protein VGL07_13860, partial [Buttiauxella sp.]